VADQDDFAGSGGDGTLRHGDVVGQGRRRVLDDGHVITVLLEEVIDRLPSGPIDEAAVNQNDGLHPSQHPLPKLQMRSRQAQATRPTRSLLDHSTCEFSF